MTEDLVTKINQLKGNIQNLWDKLSENDFELARQKIKNVSTKVQEKLSSLSSSTSGYEDDDDHKYADDLPLTINHETSPGEGVAYYTTENNPLAIGAKRVEAAGIDKFGDEKDTFDIEEANDGQDFRNRKQNSDLSDRFYSPGLDLDK